MERRVLGQDRLPHAPVVVFLKSASVPVLLSKCQRVLRATSSLLLAHQTATHSSSNALIYINSCPASRGAGMDASDVPDEGV